MKKIFLLVLLTITLQANYTFSFQSSDTLDERLSGLWSAKDIHKSIFLDKKKIKTLSLGMYTFLEIKEQGKFFLFRYWFDKEQLYLQEIAPKYFTVGNESIDKFIVEITDSDAMYTLCDKLDFSSDILCKRAEIKRILKQETQEEYTEVMQYYLLRYGDQFGVQAIAYEKKTVLENFPSALYNTKQTSLSLVHKDSQLFEPDFKQTKETLSFLSNSDKTLNIYINGLDFHHATYENYERHIKNIATWSKYYHNDILKDDYNFVYTWDTAFGIEAENTQQLENFIAYVLQGNKHNKINIIAHSHGGNLAKSVLVELYEKGINTQNIKLFTLGTPHKGIDEINTASKIFIPAVEVAYNVLSDLKNINNVDGQLVQASKRLYSGSYTQLASYESNEYLQNINNAFVERALEKNLVLIAASDDEVVKASSALWEGLIVVRETVQNKHSDLVDTPDVRIFEIIQEHK